jgi:hypothetical protein
MRILDSTRHNKLDDRCLVVRVASTGVDFHQAARGELFPLPAIMLRAHAADFFEKVSVGR